MTYCNRIDVSEGIFVHNKSGSKDWYLTLLLCFRYRVYVLTKSLQWVPWCINDVYEPCWYCYSKHFRVNYSCIIIGISKVRPNALCKMSIWVKQRKSLKKGSWKVSKSFWKSKKKQKFIFFIECSRFVHEIYKNIGNMINFVTRNSFFVKSSTLAHRTSKILKY